MFDFDETWGAYWHYGRVMRNVNNFTLSWYLQNLTEIAVLGLFTIVIRICK